MLAVREKAHGQGTPGDGHRAMEASAVSMSSVALWNLAEFPAFRALGSLLLTETHGLPFLPTYHLPLTFREEAQASLSSLWPNTA